MKVLMAGPPASGNKWLRNLFKKVTNVIEISGLTDFKEIGTSCKFQEDGYYFAPHGQIIINSIPKHVKVIHLIRDGRNACASYIAGNKPVKLAAETWNEFVKLIDKYPAPIYKYEDFVNNYQDTMERFILESGLDCAVPDGGTLEQRQAGEKNKFSKLTKEQQEELLPLIKDSLKEMKYERVVR